MATAASHTVTSFSLFLNLALESEAFSDLIFPRADLRDKIQNYPVRGDILLELAMREVLNLLHQKGTRSNSRTIMITDGDPTGSGYDWLHQFSVTPFIDHPESIGASYAAWALRVRWVEFFVDSVDRYSESLAETFSQKFLASEYSKTATVYKKLSYEMLKRLAVKSSEITESLIDIQGGLERR